MEPIYTGPLPVNLGLVDWFFSYQRSFRYYLLCHAFSRDYWSSVTQENQVCSWRYFWHSYPVIHIYVPFHMDLFLANYMQWNYYQHLSARLHGEAHPDGGFYVGYYACRAVGVSIPLFTSAMVPFFNRHVLF